MSTIPVAVHGDVRGAPKVSNDGEKGDNRPMANGRTASTDSPTTNDHPDAKHDKKSDQKDSTGRKKEPVRPPT